MQESDIVFGGVKKQAKMIDEVVEIFHPRAISICSTCPIGLICAYEDEVKDALNIPEEKRIVVGLALGHPDWDHPINRFVSPREEPAKMVRWFE